MGRIPRTLFAVASLAWLAACGPEPPAVLSDASGELETAAKWTCTVPEAADIIGEIFPPPGLRNQALAKCANILRQADRDLDDAVDQSFDFLVQTLDFRSQGMLNDPSQGTVEQAIVDLFALLFDAIGVQGPSLTAGGIGSGDYVIGQLDENGGILTVPSGFAAAQFFVDDLSGDTWVTIARILDPNPNTAGDCPFGFPVPYDCYPLFYDYSLVPESNLVASDTPVIGQCVAENDPVNSPPSQAVEDRLRLASPDKDDPGELVFWPLATAPATVDCTELEAALAPLDARDLLWSGVGPLQRLFSVSEAYANPGKLGASVSVFSPFAPTDPETGGTIEVIVEFDGEPVEDATVTVIDESENVVGSGATDENGEITFSDLPFGTYFVGATSGALSSGFEEVTLTSADPTATLTLELVPAVDVCLTCVE